MDYSETSDFSKDAKLWELVDGVDDLPDDASFESVIKYYDELLKIKPNHPVLLYRKGGFLCDADQYQDAIKLMDKILEIDSRYVDALFLKSKILSVIGKTEESKECKNRAEKTESIGLRL